MTKIKRAQGCMLGQIAGDSLGSLVESERSEYIRGKYPNGVRELADGGPHNILAGQPTDDSEMALMLARMLVEQHTYSPTEAFKAYEKWYFSGPFSMGRTTYSAFLGELNYESQANGAMMRVSPLGIFGINYPLETVANWARQDAALTHPHLVCQQVNALFTMAITHAIKTETDPESLYQNIVKWATEIDIPGSLMKVVLDAQKAPPAEYFCQQGWVLIAFQNVLWQLLHAPNLEEGVVDTVMRGGDTDTNAAICGALLGSVYGIDAVPGQWIDQVLNCRPKEGAPGVNRPRPEDFWPVDAMELVEKLVSEKVR